MYVNNGTVKLFLNDRIILSQPVKSGVYSFTVQYFSSYEKKIINLK